MTKVVETLGPEATEKLGQQIGARLKGGEVIELVSDLGGGKTTLTRGIVQGAGSDDPVSSPTFTISNEYDASELRIYHFDFYRLSEAGLMEHELDDVLDDAKSVVIVEWSDVVSHVLPEKRLRIKLESNGEEARKLTLEASEELAYLVEGL